MKSAEELRQSLIKIDHRPYPFYRDLKGFYDFGSYVFEIEHVQSDPFASPSSVAVHIDHPGYPQRYYEDKNTRTALEDMLLRMFGKAIAKADIEGGKKNGSIRISRPGQEILSRSACRVNGENGSLTVRFYIGFPASGRSIRSMPLIHILFDVLPGLVRGSLEYEGMSEKKKAKLENAYRLAMQQQALRHLLKENHLAAFVANGSILPRRSGASDLPMEEAVAFQSPQSTEKTFVLPFDKHVTGMVIPEGITLIVGGGYHGKSTLLKALEKGVYNHIEGDGREFVITSEDAMKIRSEDGRSVHQEDISSFIQNLPTGKSTECFVSEDASGSTSQAANTAEAIESGSRLLLIDEDTSATNFMVRDELMASVVDAAQEPIIPFSSRIRQLADNGVSTILVAGSSGSFFEPADLILQMNEYEPEEITQRAKEAAQKAKEAARQAGEKEIQYPDMKPAPVRFPKKNPALNTDRLKVKTSKTDTLTIAREPIDVRYLEQLADEEQLAAIGKMLVKGLKQWEGLSNTELADRLLELAEKEGLSVFGKGNLAMPRRQELLGALNRWRSMEFEQKPDTSKQN